MSFPRRGFVGRGARAGRALRAPVSLPRTQRGPIQTARLGLSAIKINGPPDPRQVRNNITVSQYFQHSIPIATADFIVTVASLTTPATRVRFERVSVFGAGQSSTLDMDGAVNVTDSTSGVSFSDSGSAGSRRPVVHYQFPLSIRQRWFATSDTTPLFVIHPGTSTPALIQYYAEVESGIA